MKFRQVLSALTMLAVAGSMVLGASSAYAEPGDAKVVGRVTDSVSGAAVANVCVVNGPVALRCWTSTNATGDYEMIIPGLAGINYSTNLQFLRTGYTTQSQNVALTGDQTITLNVSLVLVTPGVPAPSAPPPPVVGNPPPGGATPSPAPTPPAIPVEQRIADFWKRIDALAPTDNVSAGDLGGWALNVIERNPRARLSAHDFRTSTAAMQAGLDRAGLGPVPAVPPTPVPNIEQRIADFWAKIDALAPTDHVSAADLGGWALNVIARIPRAQLSVGDFRASTASMQAGFDRAGLAPLP